MDEPGTTPTRPHAATSRSSVDALEDAAHEHGPVTAGDARAWATRFDLLGDPTRLRLLARMHDQPGSTVRELADSAAITATAASQALRVLRDQGWVEAARDGRSMRYTLIDDTAHACLHLMLAQLPRE
ncbi:ArsR/SmtB family transcription factor [Kribbia dieselivorans]|uniref:ArsR/SmtB family transcription factor n=1 Tax=Kribbia dieselivorans TaxID=331526 RepID=UPI0009F87D5A|nr:helix-turn-helix transcriptional regulator [Kribbia dieselivorans]